MIVLARSGRRQCQLARLFPPQFAVGVISRSAVKQNPIPNAKFPREWSQGQPDICGETRHSTVGIDGIFLSTNFALGVDLPSTAC